MNHLALTLAAALIAAPVAASATVQETCSDLAMVAAGAITLRDKGVDMTTALDALSQVEGMTPEALVLLRTIVVQAYASDMDAGNFYINVEATCLSALRGDM